MYMLRPLIYIVSDIGHREDTSTRVKGTTEGNAAASRGKLVSFCVFGKEAQILSAFSETILGSEVLSPCCGETDTLVSAKRVLPMGGFIILSSDMNHLYPLALLDLAVVKITIVIPSA